MWYIVSPNRRPASACSKYERRWLNNIAANPVAQDDGQVALQHENKQLAELWNGRARSEL
jgi:hypothetical protein